MTTKRSAPTPRPTWPRPTMSAITTGARALLHRQLPRTVRYAGPEGTMLAAGQVPRAPSIAAMVCGDEVAPGGGRRAPRRTVPPRCLRFAADGGVALVEPALAPPGVFDTATLELPLLVDLFRPLPATLEALRDSLRTSTTREDLRRIRKAGFTYRITTDPDAIRTFHARYVTALLTSRFPEDGKPEPVETTLRQLDEGGELICLDLDGEWVAGLFNVVRERSYQLGAVGIRDGDEDIRRKHAIAALIVRSFERAVELGREEATLGRSVPFLGKGPIWFKAKWGGVLRLNPAIPRARMLMDLRHEPVRRLLAERPVIHCDGGELALALWQPPGRSALDATLREAGRYPGIARWFVLGAPATLAEGGEALAANPKIVRVPVERGADGPLWLGEVLRAPPAPVPSAPASAGP